MLSLHNTRAPIGQSLIIAAAAALLCSNGAVAQTYEFHEIASELESPFVAAADINNRGQVVGYFLTPTNFRAFLWEDGNVEVFDAPGGTDTFGNGLSDSGLIAGHSIGVPFPGANTNRGFIKAGDVFVTVNFDPFNSWAFDINNSGSVVGIYCEDGSVPGCLNDPFPPAQPPELLHAYLMDNSGFRTIDPPGAFEALGFGINDRGDAVGLFFDGFGAHGFLRSKHGEYTVIDGPDSVYTEARGINNPGEIAGFYVGPPTFFAKGYVRKKSGEFLTVEFPGALETLVWSINDHGDLCGVFLTETFEIRAFVAHRTQGR